MGRMNTHICMGCGFETRYSYRRACMSCGLKSCYSYGDWRDRHPRAAAAFAAPVRIVDLSERHPTATMVVAAPGALIGIAAVAAFPFVFVPVAVLLGVALVASTRYEQRRDESLLR